MCVPPRHAGWPGTGYEPILKKSCWCVLKRKGNLTEHQRFRLRDLLRYNLRTAQITSLFAEGGFPATAE